MQGPRAYAEQRAGEAAVAAAGAGGGRNEIDEKPRAFAAAIESRMGGAISSAGFGRTLKKFQGAVRQAAMGVVQAWANLYLFVIVLLLLFIVHQVPPPRPVHVPE